MILSSKYSVEMSPSPQYIVENMFLVGVPLRLVVKCLPEKEQSIISCFS